jgi:predicted N-acyltransferase
MFGYYLGTWHKHMGPNVQPFLNHSFFRLLGEHFRHRVRFSEARRNGDTIAMAIFYEKSGHLYGRYWGSAESSRFLHFATCYYQPLQYAIESKLRTMDPGYGGEHKLYRGYQIVPAYHYIKFYGERERRLAYALLNQIQQRATRT